MFFQQGAAQCDCLHSVAPASENKWLELCKDERSELKVYESGDHFFCHDSRFVDDMLDRMDRFIQAV